MLSRFFILTLCPAGAQTMPTERKCNGPVLTNTYAPRAVRMGGYLLPILHGQNPQGHFYSASMIHFVLNLNHITLGMSQPWQDWLEKRDADKHFMMNKISKRPHERQPRGSGPQRTSLT